MAEENNQNQATQDPGAPAAAPVYKSSLNISQNAELVLAYLFGWIGGLIFLLAEKDNKFVKFHAAQSLISSIALLIILWIVTAILIAISTALAFATLSYAPVAIFTLIIALLWLAYFALVIFMIVKSVRGEKFKLPIIGNFAENIAK